MLQHLAYFLQDSCEIYDLDAVVEDDDPYGRPVESDRLVLSLKCLYDPRVIRSKDDITSESRPHLEEITFWTEYPSDPDVITNEMFVKWSNSYYRIKFVNKMRGLNGGVGSHLEICTERATNI